MPTAALVTFLVARFSEDELRRLTRYQYGEIASELPGAPASRRQVADSLVEHLEARGLVDADFFALLRRERGRFVAEIDGLEAAYAGGSRAAGRASGPVAGSPPSPVTGSAAALTASHLGAKTMSPGSSPSTAHASTASTPSAALTQVPGHDAPDHAPARAPEAASPAGDTPVDVAILVALREEWQVLWAIAGEPRGVKDPESGRYLFRFEVASDAGGVYRCAALFIGDMGPGQATHAATSLLRLRPRILVNVGIAAAIHDDLKLCDVVVADQVDDYLATVKAAARRQKTPSYAFELRGSVYKTTHALVQDVDNLEFARPDVFAGWRAACEAAAASKPESARPRAAALRSKWIREAPAVIRAHLASGPVLAASEAFSSWVRQRDGLLKALEMEAAGMMLAAHHQGEPTPTLVLRGISDFGDARKAKTDRASGGAFRYLAMAHATLLLWALMRGGILPRGGRDVPVHAPARPTPQPRNGNASRRPDEGAPDTQEAASDASGTLRSQPPSSEVDPRKRRFLALQNLLERYLHADDMERLLEHYCGPTVLANWRVAAPRPPLARALVLQVTPLAQTTDLLDTVARTSPAAAADVGPVRAMFPERSPRRDVIVLNAHTDLKIAQDFATRLVDAGLITARDQWLVVPQRLLTPEVLAAEIDDTAFVIAVVSENTPNNRSLIDAVAQARGHGQAAAFAVFSEPGVDPVRKALTPANTLDLRDGSEQAYARAIATICRGVDEVRATRATAAPSGSNSGPHTASPGVPGQDDEPASVPIGGASTPATIASTSSRARVETNESAEYGPPMAPTVAPRKAFIMYSKDDEGLLVEFEKHLAALRHAGRVADWTDRKILAGSRWREEILARHREASVFFVLVSSSLLSTDFVMSLELPLALDRRTTDDAFIVPIIIRPCAWEQVPDLKGLQALPAKKPPVTSWPNKDEAWLAVIEGIRTLLDDLDAAPARPLGTVSHEHRAPFVGADPSGSATAEEARTPGGGSKSVADRSAGGERRRSWDAVAVVARILSAGPRSLADALDPGVPGAQRGQREETHAELARRVAGNIDALGAGIGAAGVLLRACHHALFPDDGEPETDFAVDRESVRELLCEWMPRRFDNGEAIERSSHPECPNLKLATSAKLVAAFHVSGEDNLPAEIDGKLRSKRSLEEPAALAAEMHGDELADRIVDDLLARDPEVADQGEDTEVDRRALVAGRLASRRRRKKPRDLTLSSAKWARLATPEARVRLKEILPMLRQVETTSSPDEEKALRDILIDIFTDDDDE